MRRELMMRQLLGCLTLCALLLGGYAADARMGGGASHGGTESFARLGDRPIGADPAMANPTGSSASLSPVSPLPSRAPLYGMASPSLNEGQIGAPANLGPVTGYGPGGMSRMPGSPANPPY
jgi:hypothetical protein